ncbi:MAG TPA: ABC transporter ATP-binding protein [Opitutaceae bacterium]|jgi:ABC-2 type transport system ATP-binding protein|nr:ABC transporter ATP-binding protein [Opitutaceae bacterium]
MPAAAVTLRSVTKRYGAVTAADRVSLEVAPGEIFGLIGPNGAGKTTVLECILGLTAPDSGAIAVDGRGAEAAKPLLGAQLQVSSLPDAMTPRQALTLCGKFYASPAPAAELLARFELADKADARYGSLSAGQKQRVALALALVNRPRVLILDEPTAGLDPPARADLHRLIQAQRAAGCTVLFSTHYLEEARRLCDRVALLHRGAVAALGTPEELIARSGVLARVIVRTAPDLPAEAVAPLGAAREGEGWAVASAEVQKALAALIALAGARGAELVDVQIQRPTLDDAFAKFTQ